MKTTVALAGSMLIAFALVGCSANPPQQGPQTPSTSDEVSFQSLGIDDWPTEPDLLADAPAPPAALDPATYDRITAAIAGFAEVSARDEQLRELADPLVELQSRLQDPFARLVPLVVEQETAPRVSFLDYFDSGTEITAGPVIQHVWDVRPAEDGAGATITLQTWTAYEVAGQEGSGVIGVFREYYRTEAEDGSTGAQWETSGANTCTIAVDDVLQFDSSAEQLALLEDFAVNGEEHTYEAHEVEDSITDEFKAACLDAG